MIFAVIGNIDGHEAALAATLEAIQEAGLLTILHTGNAVVGAKGGDEIMTLLHQYQVTCVQGDRDRLAVRYSRKQQSLDKKLDDALREQLSWAHEHISSQNLEILRDWRKSVTLDLEGLSVFLCHGSPGNRKEVLTADTPVAKLQRQREIAQSNIIICGGAEEAFSKDVDGTFFVSPGSLVGADGIVRCALVNTESFPWTMTLEVIPLS